MIDIKHRFTGEVLHTSQGADLRSANLMGADLEGADLYGANLGGANLGGANLMGANLEGADQPMPGPVSDVYPGPKDIQTGRRIPVSDAKRIAEAHGYDQVVIWAWDKTSGRQHVTTHGKTMLDCEQAAIAGNNVKRAAGWPESECNAKPRRATRKAKS